MAFRKISDLSSSLQPSGSGIIPISQDGETFGTTLDTIKEQIKSELTSSFSAIDDSINDHTSSVIELNVFSSSAEERLGSLETFTSSLDNSFATDLEVQEFREYFNTYTSSNNNVNTDQNTHINELELATGSLSNRIDTEKGRIDTILNLSEEDKDSFVEIVELINSVDTDNDAFAGYVVQTDGRLNALEIESGSIRNDFNHFTSSYLIASASFDQRIIDLVNQLNTTPEPTSTPVPTVEPTPNPTNTPVPTATVEPTPNPTSTPNPTATPQPTATQNPTPEPTASQLPTATPNPTSTPQPTQNPTPEPTSTPQLTPTSTSGVNLQDITLVFRINNDGGVDPWLSGSSTYNDVQNHLCTYGSNNFNSTTRQTTGDPNNPQTGDRFYAGGFPIEGAQNILYKYGNGTSVSDWRWIEVSDIGYITVSGFTCNSPTPTVEPTSTPVPTATVEPTNTPVPTATVEPTPNPTSTPVPTATVEPTQNILLLTRINSLPNPLYDILTGNFSGAQQFICNNDVTSSSGQTKQTNGDPTNPQNGDILYDDGSLITNSQFGFFWNQYNDVSVKSTWRWITTDSNGVMTVSQFNCPTSTPVPTATVEPTPTSTEAPVPTATVEPTPTSTEAPVPTATVEPTPTSTDVVSPNAICSDQNIIVQVNDGPIGEPVEPLVTYYGSRAAMIYNSVTPSTYQVGNTDYSVNFTVNSYNFQNRGDDVDCTTSATGESTIGVWDLKKGKSNPNNNVIGVDDQVTAGQMMYPAYLTNSNQATFTPMYGENNPFRPFDLYFTNNDIASGGVHARTELRINSVDANGNDRETQLDQLIGNSGIIKFRQNPKFKTNPTTADNQACWYSVENYASYRFDSNTFYKVLQSDGSYTYYYSPGSPVGNPTQYNQILTSEPNMGGSGSWYGQSYNGSLQRATTPDNGTTTYDGVRPSINVGTVQCNGFTATVGDTFDLSHDFPISISVVLDTPNPTSTPVPTAPAQPTPVQPTSTPVPTATVEPTPNPTSTPVPTATVEPTPNPTSTPVPTATVEPISTPVPTATVDTANTIFVHIPN